MSDLISLAATAAKEIKSLIAESVGRVQTGSQLVGGADLRDQLGHALNVADDLLHRVAGAASEQQSMGIGQIGDAVQQLDEVTQHNAALVEESAAAADSLRIQAARLTEVVGTFRLGAAA